ncbi:MAG: P1 family peptidase [Alphaproteobacteria bacterium]
MSGFQGGIHVGPKNALSDVSGLIVGNAQDEAVLSGVTVVLCDGVRATAAVDVSGGGPGTRETDALAAGTLVDAVDSIVLAGGSAFGLEAAGGVHAWLGTQGRGFDTGAAKVPIVPSAILYDLANGGDKNWDETPPYRAMGLAAAKAASVDFALGNAGAGYGARSGSLEGGLGTASAVDPITGCTVAALAAVNSCGDVVAEDGRFLAGLVEMDEEFGGFGPPRRALGPEPVYPKLGQSIRPQVMNTTLAVVACDAPMTREDTQRVAVMARAGFARAIRPVFSPFDGDTVFALSTGTGPSVDLIGLARIGAIAADCLSRAIARGVYEAGPLGKERISWREKYGHALGSHG